MSALIRMENGLSLGPLGRALAEMTAHDISGGLAQYFEHSIGGPGGVNVPYLNVPASFLAGAAISAIGMATRSPVLKAAGAGVRASPIAVAGAAMGLQRFDKGK